MVPFNECIPASVMPECPEKGEQKKPGGGLFIKVEVSQGNRRVLPWCWRVRLPRVRCDEYRQRSEIFQLITKINEYRGLNGLRLKCKEWRETIGKNQGNKLNAYRI